MGWAKLDDRRHTNPKLRRAGLEADGLDVRAITYCSANETDGFVEFAIVEMLAGVRHWRKVADSLAAVGRWTYDESLGGWWLHDYLEYNPSHVELESKRARDRRRKDSGRTTQRVQRDSARNPHGFQSDSSGPDSSGPDPTRPVEEANASSSEAEEALMILAKRRRAQRSPTAPAIAFPGAWLVSVMEGLRVEYRDKLASAPEGLSAEEIADWLEYPDTLERVDEPGPKPRAFCGSCDVGFVWDDAGNVRPCECRIAS